jgi:hypothetical protein
LGKKGDMAVENTPGTTDLGQPRDAAWVRALPLVVGGLLVFGALKACGFVGGGRGGLEPGTYACFTGTVTPSMRQPRTDQELQQQTGQTAVQDIIVPNMLLVPAAFGNIIIDDNGGYSLTAMDRSGDYSVSDGELTFTGDLGGLTLRSFEPANHRFTFSFQEMGIECNLQR